MCYKKTAATRPGLVELVLTLIGQQDPENMPSKRELLADSQFASLSSRAATYSGRPFGSGPQLDRILSLLLRISKVGLTHFSQEDLTFVRDFCLGLNTVFVEEIAARTPEPPLARVRYPQTVAVD